MGFATEVEGELRLRGEHRGGCFVPRGGADGQDGSTLPGGKGERIDHAAVTNGQQSAVAVEGHIGEVQAIDGSGNTDEG